MTVPLTAWSRDMAGRYALAEEDLTDAEHALARFEAGEIDWRDVDDRLTCPDRSGAALDILCYAVDVARRRLNDLDGDRP